MVKFGLARGRDGSVRFRPVRAGQASAGRRSMNYTIGRAMVKSMALRLLLPPGTIGQHGPPWPMRAARSMEQGAGAWAYGRSGQ